MTDSPNNENRLAKWLNKELSAQEIAQLKASGELDDLNSVIEDIDTWSLPPMDLNAGIKRIQTEKANPQVSKTIKLSPTRSWMRYAAAIAFLALSYFGWDYFQSQQSTVWQTAIGETKVYELPDGSKAHLDAGSTISFQKGSWEQDRTLTLEGQAFFEVVKGNSFRVNTEKATVTVLGTKFNVRASSQSFRTICYEGKVSVKSGSEETILVAGDAVEIRDDVLTPFKAKEDRPDWFSGFSKYQEVPLPQVVNDLKRHYSINIELPEKYSQLKFSGTLTHAHLKEALNTLFIPMEITYSMNEQGEVTFED